MRTPDDVFDEWLVLRCQSGDSEAIGKLVQRWHPRLMRFAMRLLHDASEAEDVVQAAWVVVVRKIGSIHDARAFRPWLFRITANKCADCIRQRTARRRQQEHLLARASAETDNGDQVAAEQAADDIYRLRKAMQKLDHDRSEILRLHYLDGHSVNRIAEKLSVPIGTVKSRLHHARRQLRESLKGE